MAIVLLATGKPAPSSASASSSQKPYPASASARGYYFQSLVQMGWISAEFAEDPYVAKCRRAIESSTFKAFIDKAVESMPIYSIEELKGAIYRQWIVQYLESGNLPTDKELFEDELWARSHCPLIVARIF